MSVSFSEAEPVNLWCRWRPLSCSFGAERFRDPGNMLRKCCMNMSPAEKQVTRDLTDDQSEESVLIERRALKEHELQWLFEAEDELGRHIRSCWNITSPIVRSQNNDRDFKLSQASSWLAALMNESDFTKKNLQHLSSVMNVIPFCEYRRESSRIMSSSFLWMVLIGQFRWTGRLSQ